MGKTHDKPGLARREADEMDRADAGEIAMPITGASGGAMPMAMNRINVPFMTAMRVPVPRDILKLKDSAVREATLAGADFIYSWTVGGAAVEGVSIEGAMILARAWGNCTVPVDVVEETPTHWTFRAVFVDLESGFTLPRLFRQRKEGVVGGRYDADRKIDMTFQIGQSKAVRNVVVRALPIWLIDACREAARLGGEERMADVPKHAQRAVDGFAKLGVTEGMLVKRLGAPREAWLPRDLVTLRAIHKALGERTTTIAEEFGGPEPPGIGATTAPAPAPAQAPAQAQAPAPAEEKPATPRQREPGED